MAGRSRRTPRGAPDLSGSRTAALAALALLGAFACSGPEEAGPGDAGKPTPPQRAEEAAPASPFAPLAPPRIASRLCGGHVSGAPHPDGTPGPHITWDAYASPETPASLSAHYLRVLGPPTASDAGACATWRIPLEQPRQVLEVCPSGASGPWSECDPPPQGSAAIVLISSMARPD